MTERKYPRKYMANITCQVKRFDGSTCIVKQGKTYTANYKGQDTDNKHLTLIKESVLSKKPAPPKEPVKESFVKKTIGKKRGK